MDDPPGAERPGQIALYNVRIFEGQQFSELSTVIIDNGKISSDECNVRTRFDGGGGYLIPGLIDAHCHIVKLSSLREITSFGITTALNMARNNYSSVDNLKDLPGLASWVTAGRPAIAPKTTHAMMLRLPASQLITDVDQVSDVVKEAFNNGSDFYEIVAEANGPSQDIQDRLVEEVHRRGKKVMTHASEFDAFKEAIKSKTDGIQHIFSDRLVTDGMASDILANGQFVTPTMSLFRIAMHNPILKRIPGASFSKGTYENVQANVKALHKAGVPIIVGTDAVGNNLVVKLPFGDMVHSEMEALVEIGFTPAEALRAATSLSAKHHGFEDRGVIAEWKRADLVLLEKNSLADIANTRSIIRIWIAGVPYEPEQSADNRCTVQ